MTDLENTSVPALRAAVSQQTAWLQNVSPEEKNLVLNRDCPPQEVRRRLDELEKLASELAEKR